MNREEALRIAFARRCDFTCCGGKQLGWGTVKQPTKRQLLEAHAALSSPCACGGREPLVDIEAETYGTTLKFPRPLTELLPVGKKLRVLIFALPAEEEGA